ncbi:MAG: glycine oxidase ThiO [Anaerolineae bacterium]|nr:glycine oxidase ThiO [Anaerolineae bacterium]
MIAIIGGGVFGLAIGRQLARSGQAVTIFEQGQVGRGATWAAAGMLMPWKLSDSFSDDLFALQRDSYHRWPRFAQELGAESTIPLHYQTDGRFFVALFDNAVKRLERQYAFHRAIGFPVEWLSGDEARQREPHLGPNVLAAIFTPMAHHIDNRQLIIALRDAFLQAGGHLREQTEVQKVIIVDERVCGVQLPDEIFTAETVIVAAGAWSGRLAGLPPTLRDVVRPRKGQTLILQMDAAAPLIKQPILGPVYLVPRPDGRLIVGTTVEREAGFDTQPTVGGVFHMLRKAQEMVPTIETLPIIELGAGLRPTGAGRLPVLGPTGVEGLIIATGGHSYGILLSPAVAEAVCDLALTGAVAPIIQPFAPHAKTAKL